LFTQLSAGLYTVHIRGGSCKKITHTVVLDNLSAAPIVAEALTPALCKVHSGSIIISDSSNSTVLEYSLDGQNWQTDTLFTGLATGWYTVTAQDPNGCLSFAEAYVRDSNSMYIEQILRNQDTAAVCAGTTVTMRALGDPAWSYAWSENGVPLDGINSFLVFVAPSDTGWVRYRVTATDANGCTATTVPLDYWVFDCSVLPNAFTPDGDGVNDTFGITGIPEQWDVDLVVFDRWGNQVFQSSPVQKFWNGTYNNQQSPSDVYVYRLHITLPDGVFVEKKGDVTLLR
jgi:gliding motility-associated-like protein